jgi:hypothetical protein
VTLTREQIQASIDRNLGVLNRLESHLGCAKCHGQLTDGRCPVCQAETDGES